MTGASRGVGRGIARGLGEAGATVYVTGRTVEEGTSPVPYGVAHAAIDRRARDTVEDLRPHGVASVSLYPGLVLTESVVANLQHFADEPNRETPLFVGRAVAALAADPDVLRLTGRWLVPAEVAAAYGVTDEHGHLPVSNRPAILGEPVPPQR